MEEKEKDKGLRRRLVLLGLGLKPGDLKELLNTEAARISYLLGAQAHLREVVLQ